MANVLVADVEVVAKDLLGWFTGAAKKVNAAGPGAVAGLATILGAVAASINAASTAATQEGLNIALDVATVTAVKAVWPDIEAFVQELGIKL